MGHRNKGQSHREGAGTEGPLGHAESDVQAQEKYGYRPPQTLVITRTDQPSSAPGVAGRHLAAADSKANVRARGPEATGSHPRVNGRNFAKENVRDSSLLSHSKRKSEKVLSNFQQKDFFSSHKMRFTSLIKHYQEFGGT